MLESDLGKESVIVMERKTQGKRRNKKEVSGGRKGGKKSREGERLRDPQG